MGKKLINFSLFITLVVPMATAMLQPALARSEKSENQKTETIELADGTPVHLILMDDLQGKKLRNGQTVHLEVRQDLYVGSALVIKTGAEAIGHVQSISKSGLIGRSGKLVLEFNYVNAVSGARIALRGGARVSGGKGGALTWESALWYGPNANLAVGTIINAYVNQDQKIHIR